MIVRQTQVEEFQLLSCVLARVVLSSPYAQGLLDELKIDMRQVLDRNHILR